MSKPICLGNVNNSLKLCWDNGKAAPTPINSQMVPTESVLAYVLEISHAIDKAGQDQDKAQAVVQEATESTPYKMKVSLEQTKTPVSSMEIINEQGKLSFDKLEAHGITKFSPEVLEYIGSLLDGVAECVNVYVDAVKEETKNKIEAGFKNAAINTDDSNVG